MKKVIYFLLGAGLLAGTHAQAQFETGERFVSGSIHLGGNVFAAERFVNSFSGYNHSFYASLGRMTRENRAVGWSLSNQIELHDRNGLVPKAPSLRTLNLGVGRFVEFYKPLGEKWALYLRPSFSVNYQLQNSYVLETPSRPDGSIRLRSQSQSHGISIDTYVGGGVLWRFAPKWAFQGSIGGISPLRVLFRRTRSEQYNSQTGAVEYKNIDHRAEYAIQPGLSIGNVGLGFRYFY